MNEPQRHPLFIRLERWIAWRERLGRVERNLGYWSGGWLLIVVLAFIVRCGYNPSWLTWQMTAWIAGGQTGMLLAILVVNNLRWRAETKRVRIEGEIARSGIAGGF